MTSIDILSLVLSSGAVFGIITVLVRLGRVLEKIDNIDKRTEKMDQKMDQVSDRITRLEVRVEERTLRVIHTEKTGSETH